MSIDPSTQSSTSSTDRIAPARKFMFDQAFDDATVIHRSPERKPVLMKQEQIDALKKENFDLGVEAGKSEEQGAQAAHIAELLSGVEKNIATLIKNLNDVVQEQNTQTRNLALAIAKKILPDLSARGGLQEIESLLTSTIREMAREPRLVVRIDEGHFDVVDEKIQAIAAQLAYAGKVIVLADDTVAAGDCRIEWADGGVERDTKATFAAIEETILPSS